MGASGVGASQSNAARCTYLIFGAATVPCHRAARYNRRGLAWLRCIASCVCSLRAVYVPTRLASLMVPPRNNYAYTVYVVSWTPPSLNICWAFACASSLSASCSGYIDLAAGVTTGLCGIGSG